jgi:hypothetical protein
MINLALHMLKIKHEELLDIYENPDHGHSPLYEVERVWG